MQKVRVVKIVKLPRRSSDVAVPMKCSEPGALC
jgi:hypothetical protein